jgi:hypothetical protein
MDLREMHLLNTDSGVVVVKTHKRPDGKYQGEIDDYNTVVSADDLIQCLVEVKKAYDLHVNNWVVRQLVDTGVVVGE